MADFWVSGYPGGAVLGDANGGVAYWNEGYPVAPLDTPPVPHLDVVVFDSISAADDSFAPVLRGTLLAAAFPSDRIHVTDAPHLALTPLSVRVFEALTVSDAVPGIARRGPLNVAVADTVTIGERFIHGPLRVKVHETITVQTSYPSLRVPDKSFLSVADFIRVQEMVKAQFYIGGGLAIRVHDTISVQENPFYLGYRPATMGPTAGTGAGDPGALGAGPEPGSPTGLPPDYWLTGV